MDNDIRVGLYARVRSERQAEEDTIASQLDVLRRRIADDGHTLEEALCFIEDGYSGSTWVRPGLEQLRDLAYCGGIDQVYVLAPDRLARNYAHQAVLLEEWGRCQVAVVFCNRDKQPSSPEEEMLVQMQGMFAEYERAKILERTRRGKRFAVRQGKVSALAHAPFGYRYVSKRDGDGEARYDIVPEQAQVVRSMFDWVGLQGLSLGEVVRRLADSDIVTVTGKPRWDRATIHGILTNPAYTGKARFGKTRLVPRTPGRRPKRGDPPIPRRSKVARPTDPEEQEPIPVPALISDALFAVVAERLQENQRRHRAQKNGAEFLLGGLLVCHRCGSAYCGRRQPRRDGDRYVYSRCLGTDAYRHGGTALCDNPSVRGEVEDLVWSDVCALLQDPDRLRREWQRRGEQPTQNTTETGRLQESIGQLKQRMGRLLDAYESGFLEKAEFQTRMSRLKERPDREQETLAGYHKQTPPEDELRMLVEQFEGFASQIRNRLAEREFETKRQLLRLLIQRIEVDTDTIRIVYKVQHHPFVVSPERRGFLQHCLKFRTTTSRFGIRLHNTYEVTLNASAGTP